MADEDKIKLGGAFKELGQGLPPEAIHSDVDLAFASECTAPPSAAFPIIESARWEIRFPVADADIPKTFGNTINVWGTKNGESVAGVAATGNTLGTPGLLPGPHIIFGWRIRLLTDPEQRRIPGNQYTPVPGSPNLPGSPDAWTLNDLARALDVPPAQAYLPAELLYGLPGWLFSYAFIQAMQANWFVNHQESMWKEPMTQCAYIEPFSEAEAAGLSFVTNQHTILETNRRLVDLGIGSQFLPVKFTRTGSVTAIDGNIGNFSPTRAEDAASTTFGGIGVPQDILQKRPFMFSTPVFWPRGQPMQFQFEVNANTTYQETYQRWLSVTGGTNGQPGLDQALPFSDVINGTMPSTSGADIMVEQTDDAAPVNTPQQVPTTIALQKNAKTIIEVGLIAKRVPPAWYNAVARAIAMRALICPEGPGDLDARVDAARQALKAA